MGNNFNPYYEWLGIPPKHQPANHYRLLGIERFEADPVVIKHAAEQRLKFLRTKQTGQRGKLADQLLNEISRAKATLINANTKTKYDQALQKTLLKTAESTSSLGPQQSASAHTDRTGRTGRTDRTDRTADRLRGRGRNATRKSPGRSSASSLLRFGLVAIVAIIAIAYGFYRWQQAAEQQRRQQAEIAQLAQRLNTEKSAKENSVKNETSAREEAEAERKEEAERKAKEEAAAAKRRKEEAERKAKEKEEAERKAQVKELAARKAKEEEEEEEAERKAQEEKEKQRQETLQWRKAHFTQLKNGAWQPNLSEQWGRELKQAKQTGSSVSKDGKQFKKREKEINTLMALVGQAKMAYQTHIATPILNNAVRQDWINKRNRLDAEWSKRTISLNKEWLFFWATAKRFVKSLDALEQEHTECEAIFTKMRQLYKQPQMNRAKQIEPDVNFSSLKETKKQTGLRALQGIINNAQPTREKLIALNNRVQELKAAQQAQQQQLNNRNK